MVTMAEGLADQINGIPMRIRAKKTCPMNQTDYELTCSGSDCAWWSEAFSCCSVLAMVNLMRRVK